jgi:hypothetical protein
VVGHAVALFDLIVMAFMRVSMLQGAFLDFWVQVDGNGK